MRNDPDLLKQVKLIRWGARALLPLPFARSTIVEACVWVELAGMPSAYSLSSTAWEYAALENDVQLAVLLSARVGNARIPPAPPLWPVLALVLLGWRDTMTAARVKERAAELDVEEEVHRGLAIVAYLFPELEAWLNRTPSKLPRWERALAVPLAARKLTRFENTD